MGDVGGCVMKVLDPLVYCEMKFVDRDQVVSACGYFAAKRIKGMPFCEKCAERFEGAQDEEGVEYVPDLYIPIAQMAVTKKRGA